MESIRQEENVSGESWELLTSSSTNFSAEDISGLAYAPPPAEAEEGLETTLCAPEPTESRSTNGPPLRPVRKYIEQTSFGCLFYYSPSSGAQIFLKKHQRLKLYRRQLVLSFGPLVDDFEANANERTKLRREQDLLIPLPPCFFFNQDRGPRAETRDVGTSMETGTETETGKSSQAGGDTGIEARMEAGMEMEAEMRVVEADAEKV